MESRFKDEVRAFATSLKMATSCKCFLRSGTAVSLIGDENPWPQKRTKSLRSALPHPRDTTAQTGADLLKTGTASMLEFDSRLVTRHACRESLILRVL